MIFSIVSGRLSVGPVLRLWTAAALLLLVIGCSKPGQEEPLEAREGTGGAEEQESVPVKVMRPFRGEITQSIRATTSIVAKYEADVYSKQVGFCQRVLAEEGDAVRKGDLLAKLEEEEIRLAFGQVSARLNKAETDYGRAKDLVADGLISRQMFQDLSLQLDLAKADHELSKKRLEDTSIVAPLAGVVTERGVKVSDLVNTTQPLFKIVDLEHLEAGVHIPEQDYLKVRKGQEAMLRIDAFPDRSFLGRVERISPVIDSGSGTAKATIDVRNPEGVLRPGMFVRVQIITAVHPDALIIPKEAILMQGERRAVFVVEEGSAREITVQTGFQDADRVEVVGGLAEEDVVIVRGHLGLQGDTRVRIIEELHG